MNYREKISNLGIDLSKLRGSSGKIKCPQCSHTRKKKNDPCLSVNVSEGWWRCFNCDWHGSAREYSKKETKEYRRPVLTNQTDCSDEILKWFMGRGINPITLQKNKVRSGLTWMPQTGKEEITVQFNYLRLNEVVNIKHRDGQKNFRMEKDAELIFYGLDDLNESEEYILIAEGETCKLSWNEAGVHFALSVPNGASGAITTTLDYLDNCWDYFNNDKKIILALDNDQPGMILREELARRLGKDRCYKIDFGKHKDANEVLVAEGTEKLKSIIRPENLIKYPIGGVIEIDDVWEDVEYIMSNGLPRGRTTRIWPNFDDHFSFDGGQLCVVTGIPNSGKSPFCDMSALIMSIRYGWKWGICSMESKPLKKYIVKLSEKIIGKFIRPGVKVTDDQKERIRSFLSNHFYFIEANYANNELDTMEFILTAAKGLVRRHGIKGLIIDPWNKIEHQIGKGENETNYISRTLDELIRFEQAHDLFVFLVAHPSKMSKVGKEYSVPDLYNVSGSSNFYNKPDWGVTVHRNYTTGLTEIHITKVKDEHLGKMGVISMRYNGGNGRLGEPNDKLDFTNWLDSLPSLTEKVSDAPEGFGENIIIDNSGQVPDTAPF